MCEKSLLFVDLMAQKLRSKGYYLKEREKEGVKMLVPSEKVINVSMVVVLCC